MHSFTQATGYFLEVNLMEFLRGISDSLGVERVPKASRDEFRLPDRSCIDDEICNRLGRISFRFCHAVQRIPPEVPAHSVRP
jgi:hypothetical protein